MTDVTINDEAPQIEALVSEPEAQSMLGVPAEVRGILRQGGVPAEQLRALHQINVRRVLLELGLTLGPLVAVPVLYALAPHPLTFVLCFILSVRNSNCLAQLIHASDHGSLFRHPGLNVAVGNACASLLGYTRAGHRLAHLRHHLYLNTERDPDLVWATPQQTSRDLVRAWCHDFLFLSALKRLLQYAQTEKKTFSVRPWRNVNQRFIVKGLKVMWPVVVVQLGVLAVYSVLVGPVFYFVLYVLPIMTFYPAQIRLRSTVEHSFDIGYEAKSPADLWVTRSTQAGWFERFVFAPYGIDFHFEHHLFPTVPHYNLKKVREVLRGAGVAIPLAPGYIRFVVRRLNAERRQLAPRSTA